MAGYDPTSVIRASIFLGLLSVSLFAVFLSCKDRCLFYSFTDNYWMPLWVGILGLFLGVFGVAMGCSKRSSSRSPPCVGTVFCEFIFVFMFACLGCLLIITRPILALYGHLPSIQIDFNITYVTDLLQRNLTAIEDFDTKYTASFIHWGVLAGIAICLVFLSFCMSCMYCCCCQEESRPPRQPKPKTTQTNNQTNKRKQKKSPGPNKTEMTAIKHISPPKTDARPPPFTPTLSGDTSKDAFLFPNASAPHFSTSPTLTRDIMKEQGLSTGNSFPPGVSNTVTPVHTIQRVHDTPPAVPTSPRPSLTRQSQVTSNDDDDHVDYVLPNNPTTSTRGARDDAYLLPQSAPAEYIEAIGDENYEQINDYNYAYDHDVETLARNHGAAAASATGINSVTQAEQTYTDSDTNITKNDRLDEYNYPYEHEVEALARRAGSNEISYY